MIADEKADSKPYPSERHGGGTAIFSASLSRDRIAPINSQNPTPNNV